MKESKIFSGQNLTEIIHYVYRVTIDEKYYIGKRTGRLDDLRTGHYKTSSNLVHEKLRNGVTFSKIKILQVFSSSKDALEFESRILTRVSAKTNPKFLNQTNGGGNYTLKQHTEKSKEKMSKSQKEYYNTEEGIKNRENLSNKKKEFFDPNTEEGRKNKEHISKKQKEARDENTERGRKLREDHSDFMIGFYKTEQGKKLRENHSKKMKEYYNPDTEDGRRNKEIQSEKGKERFNPETDEGRKRRENHSKKMKEKAKERLQNRKNASILGELMFDEEFIRKNFLIIDNKNNQRFLLSAYSKLSRFSESRVYYHKQKGKLSFLHGIKSIALSEEDELTKIKEIEAIIKSRNEKE